MQNVLGIPCSRSPIESFTPSGDIHLMCMNHVLEHVAEPIECLRNVTNLLSDEGRLYIEVPYADHRFKDDVFPHTWFRECYLSRY